LESVLKPIEAKITVFRPKPEPKSEDSTADQNKDKEKDPKSKPAAAAAAAAAAAPKSTEKDTKSISSKPTDSKSGGDTKKPDTKPETKEKDKKEKEVTDKTQATGQSAPYIQAATLLKTEIVRRKCDLHKLDDAKELLDECKQQIDNFMGIMEAIIHSHYYLAAFQYFKLKGAAADYFRHSLLYLTYTPLPTISVPAQHTLAADVGMAALLGDDTYNFGELLQHAILRVLENTPQSWIAHLLYAFSAGDIAKFNQIFRDMKDKEAMLSKNAEFLNQKVRIMALMEMVLKRGSHTRTLNFQEISTTCDLKTEHVEFMLMKAFSLRVVRGSIDEVHKTVQIKWVQPRVLDIKQVGQIRDRLKQWAKDVHSTANYLQESAPTLLGGHTS